MCHAGQWNTRFKGKLGTIISLGIAEFTHVYFWSLMLGFERSFRVQGWALQLIILIWGAKESRPVRWHSG